MARPATGRDAAAKYAPMQTLAHRALYESAIEGAGAVQTGRHYGRQDHGCISDLTFQHRAWGGLDALERADRRGRICVHDIAAESMDRDLSTSLRTRLNAASTPLHSGAPARDLGLQLLPLVHR